MAIAEHTRTVDDTGRIPISGEARAELGLVAGTRLMELVVDGMLLYVPVRAEIIEAFDDLERRAAERGVSAEDLIADLESDRERETLVESAARGGE